MTCHGPALPHVLDLRHLCVADHAAQSRSEPRPDHTHVHELTELVGVKLRVLLARTLELELRMQHASHGTLESLGDMGHMHGPTLTSTGNH